MILFHAGHLRRVLVEYVAHYNADGPHQGLSNELIRGKRSKNVGEVVETERLGELLRSYHRAA